ncbi:hydantoinase B/oxoprolinase family protein [Komagataeibacter nataicola]|uniref:hydantoinase B/oxoprolinase family protein n=1 Tax=Komagataeibacter nataicola TaxID=265960 RepID=UPI0038D1ECE8
MQLDPITLEILNNQVVSVVEEMCMTLQRVGRSLYVKETADFACALAGVDGKILCLSRLHRCFRICGAGLYACNQGSRHAGRRGCADYQ